MAVVPDGGPEGTVLSEITPHNEPLRDRTTPSPRPYDEKNPDIEVVSAGPDSDYDDATKIYVPEDSEEFIDPRLKDCTCDILPHMRHDPLAQSPWRECERGEQSITAY